MAEGDDDELQYPGLVLDFDATWRAWKDSEQIFRLLGDLVAKVPGVALRLRGLDAGLIYVGIGWVRMEWLESGPVFVKQEWARPWLGGTRSEKGGGRGSEGDFESGGAG